VYTPQRKIVRKAT